MTSAMSVDVVQQAIGTIGAPVTGVPASTAINNVLLMIFAVSAILYFFFSSMRGYATKAPMKQIIRTGRIIVLVAIGAMFGLQLTAYTVIMMDIFNYVLTGIRLLIL